MGLESATYISGLVTTNPVGTDDRKQVDDQIRLVKSALKASINLSGAVTASHTELNILDGATVTTTELNSLTGVTGNVETRLDALEGGTGAVQGPASSVNDRIATFDGVTGSLIQDSGVLISELATSAQMATKAPLASPALTGSPTINGKATLIKSAQLTVADGYAANTLYTVAHSLGVVPFQAVLFMECKTDEGGWVAGEVVTVSAWDSGGGGNERTPAVYMDGTNLNVKTPLSALYLPHKTSGAIFQATAANWKILARCIA